MRIFATIWKNVYSYSLLRLKDWKMLSECCLNSNLIKIYYRFLHDYSHRKYSIFVATNKKYRINTEIKISH